VGGLWAVGTAQAAVAARALFGLDAAYVAPNTMVSLKMDGIDVKGYGRVDSEDAETIQDSEEAANIHRRLAVKDGRIIGAVFVGPPGTAKDLPPAINAKADLTPVLDKLRNGNWAALGDI